MSSERIQRRIKRLLDIANEAASRGDWEEVKRCVEDVIAVDPDNVDVERWIVAIEQTEKDLLLDQIDEAADQRDWEEVRRGAKEVLSTDPDNVDAQAYLIAADRIIGEDNLSVSEVAEDQAAPTPTLYDRKRNRPSVQSAIRRGDSLEESWQRVGPVKHEKPTELQTKPTQDSRRNRYAESIARRYRTTTPDRQIKPEVAKPEPEHITDSGQAENHKEAPNRTEGFHLHGGMVMRGLSIVGVGLIFGVIGQVVSLLIGAGGTAGSPILVAVGYIIGGIIGNKIYDRGSG